MRGCDVVEYDKGNSVLTPADKKVQAAGCAVLAREKSFSEWLVFWVARLRIVADVWPWQIREFMLDSTGGFYRRGEVVFEKGEPGSSLFAIAEGPAEVEVAPGVTVPIEEGSIFGEVGLI